MGLVAEFWEWLEGDIHSQVCPQLGAIESWVHLDLSRLLLLSCPQPAHPLGPVLALLPSGGQS